MKQSAEIVVLRLSITLPLLGFLLYRVFTHPENPFSGWFLYFFVCYLLVCFIIVFAFKFKRYVAPAQSSGLEPARFFTKMSPILKPINVWALVLLVLALLSAGSFIVHGVRVGLPPMFIVGAVGAVFNGVLLVYSLLGPLYSDRELRYSLFSLVFHNCFYIVGAFTFAYNRSMISMLAVIAGVTVYFLDTRKRLRRLHRRRGKISLQPKP